MSRATTNKIRAIKAASCPRPLFCWIASCVQVKVTLTVQPGKCRQHLTVIHVQISLIFDLQNVTVYSQESCVLTELDKSTSLDNHNRKGDITRLRHRNVGAIFKKGCLHRGIEIRHCAGGDKQVAHSNNHSLVN